MARQGRVQAPQLNSNLRLQPAGIQSDTYAAPADIPRNENAFRLAEALRGFSNSFGNLAPVLAQKNEMSEEAKWAMEKRIAGRTREEWVADTKAGIIMPHQNEFEQKMVRQAQGMNYGSYRADEIKQLMMTGEFDWDSQDPDEYISSIIRSDLEQYGTDRNFGGAYVREVDKVRGWAVTYRENRNAEKFNQQKDDAAFGRMDIKMTEWLDAGVTPAEFPNRVRSMYQELGREGVIGVDYGRLDQHTVALARHIVDQYPDHALSLMEATHVGRDGQKVRLADKPAFRDIYENLRVQAVKARDAIAEAGYRQVAANEASDLFRQARFDTVVDRDVQLPSGKYVTITKDQLQDVLHRKFEEDSSAYARSARETPAMQMSRELDMYRKNGLEHPRIKAEVTGIADMITPAALQDPDQLQRIREKMDTAVQLSNDQKATYMAYVEQKDREVVEMYQIAKSSLKHRDGRVYSDAEALAFASEVANPTSVDGRNRVERYSDEIDREIKKAGTNYGILWNSSTAPGNFSTVRSRVVRVTQALVAHGMEPQAAVKQAAEHIKSTLVQFNGDLLMDLGGMEVPEDFEASGLSLLEEIATANPLTMKANNVGVKDITLQPLNNPDQRSYGRFRLISKEDRLPILTDGGQPIDISLGDIRARSQQLREKAKQDAINKAAEDARKDKEAYDGAQQGIINARERGLREGRITPEAVEKAEKQRARNEEKRLRRREERASRPDEHMRRNDLVNKRLFGGIPAPEIRGN